MTRAERPQRAAHMLPAAVKVQQFVGQVALESPDGAGMIEALVYIVYSAITRSSHAAASILAEPICRGLEASVTVLTSMSAVKV